MRQTQTEEDSLGGPMDGDDPVAGALNLVTAAGEETAKGALELVAHSKAASEERSNGASVSDMMAGGHPQEILGSLERMAKHLLGTGAKLRKAMVKGLANEGWGVAKISRLFGVSHQRISALLKRDRPKQ